MIDLPTDNANYFKLKLCAMKLNTIYSLKYYLVPP